MPKTLKEKKSTKKSTNHKRPVKYDRPSVKMFVGDKSLTSKITKQLLGWQEVTDGPYLLKDLYGKKIVCHNNITNRPFSMSIVAVLKQEILRRRWYLNLESRIIGCSGLVLNGQHTFIALILAVQEWELHPEIWKEFWKTEPVIETSIGFGVDESDKVVNTMDTPKPRTLAHVIYRSPYFSDYLSKDRAKIARFAQFGVQMLWNRTGVSSDCGLRKTHSEMIDFIERHKRILDCIRHIYEENGTEGRVTKFITAGYASALLYLMASSNTKSKVYYDSSSPSEDTVDWSNWDKACDFWVCLAGGDPKLDAIGTAISNLVDEEGSSPAERCAIIVKGWLIYCTKVPITEKALSLEYHEEDDVRELVEFPTTGGIDLGKPDSLDTPANDDPRGSDPSQEEIEERSSKVRSSKASKKDGEDAPVKLSKSAGKQDGKTDARHGTTEWLSRMAWVSEKDGETWRGKVVEVLGKNARLKVAQGFQGASSIRTVLVHDLRRANPTGKG
ncbi:hypothetical protein LCGC14_0940160 [marine sediment metagenome]|uniref:Uncharacterized protein n=1 Tax=marine sediment metagenome TaxID=412755 RepID=A0A0F9RRN8_9ZZZZ